MSEKIKEIDFEELDATKKYVVELDIYTDGDYRIDFEDLKDHKSRYLEQDLYEYTIIDPNNYRYKVRRVFDAPDDALSFFDITDRISEPHDYFVTDILMERINLCIEEFWRFGRSNDFIDENITIDMAIYTAETSAKKIKSIIFENSNMYMFYQGGKEMEEAIDRAIEKFWDDYALLYDASLYGRNNTNMPDHEYVAPSYYARSTLRSLCIRLIAELCGAEVEKVKGESSSDVCSDPDHVKCPSCGHIGIEWNREHDWYCPNCYNYVEYKGWEG